VGICDKLKKDEFYLMEVVMTEESSQQFTSTGTTSARNVSPTKASSVRPVNRQPIRQVSSNTQSPQTKYIYAGIGEQPLTQREFDENLKNLRSTLAEVESLLHGDMKNPENIKRCQQLLGFATSLRLPQEVKDKEIRSYPPAVQHLYETVKNEGSSASPAAQMAQTRHATTAMAQIMASDAHTVADLKAAIANGWDINAKHLNPDGSYSTYVDYQGKVLSETAAFDERLIARLDEIMAMPDGPEKERALKEHQAAADANHQRAMMAVDNVGAALQTGKLNPEEKDKSLKALKETEEHARKEAQHCRDLAEQATTPKDRKNLENLARQYENLANNAKDYRNCHKDFKAVCDDFENQSNNSSQEESGSGNIGSATKFSNDGEKSQSAVANNQRAIRDLAEQATTPKDRKNLENLARQYENLANNAKDYRNYHKDLNRFDDWRNKGDNSSQENRGSDNIGSEREFSNDGEKSQSAVANHQRAMMAVDNVGAALQTGKLTPEDGDNALKALKERAEQARKEAQRYRDLAEQATTPEAREHLENLAQQKDTLVSQAQGILSTTDVREVHRVVADAPSSIQSVTDASRNLNGASGMVSARQRRDPINIIASSKSEQPSITDAMVSMGNGNVHASGDLDFGIVPGGSIGTTPIKPAGRSKGFKRGGIAGTNRTFDLGTIGLVSTTVAPKVPENTADNEPTITEQATINNSIVTPDNSSSSQKLADLTTTSDAKKENPLGKPVNLEETSDINLLTVRSQQSQAMV